MSFSRGLCALAAVISACATTRDKGGLVAHPELSPTRLAQLSGRRLAVLIGVDRPSDESWPALQFAGKDAADLAGVLAGQGRFETELLATGAVTTRAEVLAALERLKAKNKSPQDVVVVYFSGHGTLARKPGGELQRYLVTSDASRADPAGSALAVEELDRLFEALPSRRKALVLAACHSGSGKSRLPEEVEAELKGLKGETPRPLSEVSRAVTTLSASAWGQPAREDDGLRHDIYTHFFLEALVEKKDRNRDGAVSAEEAHDYARTRTYYFTQGRQTPSAESTVVGVDPVVLVGEQHDLGLPELGSYEERLNGAEVRVDGVAAGLLPGSIAVAPGAHRVQVVKGGATVSEARVEVLAGERLDLADLDKPRRSRLSLELRGGYQFLLTEHLRSKVGGSLPLVSLGVWLPRLLLGRVDLGFDLQFGRIATSIAPDGVLVPVTLTLTEVGLLAELPFTFGRFTLGVGPRLSFAWFARSYPSSATAGTDTALLTVPGLALDGRFLIGAGFSALLGARVSYSALSVDGVTTHLGAASVWAGVGYGLP